MKHKDGFYKYLQSQRNRFNQGVMSIQFEVIAELTGVASTLVYLDTNSEELLFVNNLITELSFRIE